MGRFLAITIFLLSVNSQAAGQFVKENFQNQFGSRDYYKFTPQNYNAEKKYPLLVALHGCTQTAIEFASESGFNDLADKYGFIAIYPEQSYSDNILRCWNWFKPENQKRGGGENGLIVALVEKLKSELNIDASKIFITGLSAGAAMASNIYGCHMDLFSGLGVHSGLEFRAATTEVEAQQVIRNGATQDLNLSARAAIRCNSADAKMGKIVVIRGSHDKVVNPVNSDRTISQFAKINDWLDDSNDNLSQSTNPIDSKVDRVPNGYVYRVDLSGGKDGVHIAAVTVMGMGHAWSGAHKPGQYADTKGPDAAEIMWQFFNGLDDLGK